LRLCQEWKIKCDLIAEENTYRHDVICDKELSVLLNCTLVSNWSVRLTKIRFWWGGLFSTEVVCNGAIQIANIQFPIWSVNIRHKYGTSDYLSIWTKKIDIEWVGWWRIDWECGILEWVAWILWKEGCKDWEEME
jgi:hypothetical protein